MKIVTIGERKIAIEVAKLFFQEGLPFEIINDISKEKGIEISWLHVTDDLIKNGWKKGRITNTLSNILLELPDVSIFGKVQQFLNADYDEQRKMIFIYLFKDEETAKDWFRKNVI